MARCSEVTETTFCTMVAADVVGVSRTAATHAKVVVHVEAP